MRWIRALVLGILWISVACFGLCGTIDLVNMAGHTHSGGESFAGIAATISGIALAVLLPIIWLITRFTGPRKGAPTAAPSTPPGDTT